MTPLSWTGLRLLICVKTSTHATCALLSARSCLYGSRGLGDKKWFSVKAGIAPRLKTQTQRSQFRLGLVANNAIYNRLNLLDLISWLDSGTSSDLATFRPEATFIYNPTNPESGSTPFSQGPSSLVQPGQGCKIIWGCVQNIGVSGL